MNQDQFDICRPDETAVQTIMSECGLPHFIAAVLVGRGYTTAPVVEKFFKHSLEADWCDPYTIPGLKEVVDSLADAVRQDKHVLVFGDYDLDGISATTVMTRALRELGAQTTPFIPKRETEGYAISRAALDRIDKENAANRPDVIVTVDCGISCRETVAVAQKRGYDVLVTDHHEKSDEVDSIPVGIPVCDPKLDPQCQSAVLAGVGVALKVVQALGSRFGRPHLWQDYIDFATLGTIADLMPMTGENRALVATGIYKINAQRRPCLEALLQVAGAADKPVTSSNLSFSVIPRLNAAGRMDKADIALNLLLSDDYAAATAFAEQLNAVNDERKKAEAALYEVAASKAAARFEQNPNLRSLVLWPGKDDDDPTIWHEGVKGIVASKLVNDYKVPCLIFKIKETDASASDAPAQLIAAGSGRTVGQINLFRAIESCKDIIIQFGGHNAACGLSLDPDKLPEFAARFEEYMQNQDEKNFKKVTHVDAVVTLDELTLENVEMLSKLEPYGQTNLEPVFLAEHVMLDKQRPVGTTKEHLQCNITDGKNPDLAAIKFRCKDIEKICVDQTPKSVAFTLQIDEWNKRKTVKAMLGEMSEYPDDMIENPDIHVGDLDECADAVLTPAADKPVQSDANLEQDAVARNREMWNTCATQDPEQLTSAIVKALIGSAQPHPAQLAALESLEAGKNVLSIMGTGRGKSFVFQVHATKLALTRGRMSLFVYPLRALINDQAYHLNDTLKVFGITSEVLNGETAQEERARIFADMADGKIDIVLTTPEFLECHAGKFGAIGRIGFVVIDEAHHIAQVKTGQRSAYAALPQILHSLSNPTLLACTATAGDDVAESIEQLLPIDEIITDKHTRSNLRIVDQRNNRRRENYLVSLIDEGEKTIIYVNSRYESVNLARILRNRVPHMALQIGYYNGGMSRAERAYVEELFRNGTLQVLLATSAFGEGVDIPDIRNVVLYHLPYSRTELNQIAGRAGRDGRPARIHLLFNADDAKTNDQILQAQTPDRDVLAAIYKSLRAHSATSADNFFRIVADDFVKLNCQRPSVDCGLSVFSELNLIETRSLYVDGNRVVEVRVKQGPDKVELQQSVRYREGFNERNSFDAFKKWVMNESADDLSSHICNPIYPTKFNRTFGGDE